MSYSKTSRPGLRPGGNASASPQFTKLHRKHLKRASSEKSRSPYIEKKNLDIDAYNDYNDQISKILYSIEVMKSFTKMRHKLRLVASLIEEQNVIINTDNCDHIVTLFQRIGKTLQNANRKDAEILEFIELVNRFNELLISQDKHELSAKLEIIRLHWTYDNLNTDSVFQKIRDFSADKVDCLKADIYEIYQLCTHGKFEKSREKMKDLDFREIKKSDDLKVCWHWAILHLGLTAFADGMWKYAHMCLSSICEHPRVNDLLGDWIYLDLELVKACYATSSFLVSSSNFELSVNMRLLNSGTPNRSRVEDKISAYCLALGVTLKKNAYDHDHFEIFRDELVNNQIWSLFHNGDEVRCELKYAITGASVRKHLSFSIMLSKEVKNFSDHIDLQQIADQYEVPVELVQQIASEMIDKDNLSCVLNDGYLFTNPSKSDITQAKKRPSIKSISSVLFDDSFSILV